MQNINNYLLVSNAATICCSDTALFDLSVSVSIYYRHILIYLQFQVRNWYFLFEKWIVHLRYIQNRYSLDQVLVYINLLVKFVVYSLQNNLVLDAQKNGHTEQEYIYILYILQYIIYGVCRASFWHMVCMYTQSRFSLF